MHAEQAFTILLDFLAGKQEANIYLNAHDLKSWPGDAVEAMKAQQLLNPAKPAATAICPGCEEQCVMPIQTITHDSGAIQSFALCDRRDDTNRVLIDQERRQQWACSITAIKQFIVESLQLRPSQTKGDNPWLIPLGMIKGNQYRQMLCLNTRTEVKLVVGAHDIPLADVIEFKSGRFRIDVEYLTDLADRSDPAYERYTPSNARREARKLDTQEMYEAWRKAYRQLKKANSDKNNTWIANKIARMDIGQGRDSETIRKQMVK